MRVRFQNCVVWPSLRHQAFSSETFKRVVQTVFHYGIDIVDFIKALFKSIRFYKTVCRDFRYLNHEENYFMYTEIIVL